MSLMQPTIQERRPSPGGMSLDNLASNNPFRRAVSPISNTTPVTSPLLSPPSREQTHRMSSTNPFLDGYQPPPRPPPQRSPSPPKALAYAEPSRNEAVINTRNPAETTQGLVVSNRGIDRPIPDRSLKPYRNGERGATIPTVMTHRQKGSQDEKRRMHKTFLDPTVNPVGVFAGVPDWKENRRPRRNSDTSIMEAKEDERRQKDGLKIRDPKMRGKPKKPNRQVDLIDKLDVTSIYGAGMFHHDGPFDACNPQRNRKGHRAAPMQAFAEGSLNNAIGGSGPVNKGLDFDRIHGRGAEGFDDYNNKPVLTSEPRNMPRRPAPDFRRDNVPPQYRRQPEEPRPDYRLAPLAPPGTDRDSVLIDDPKGHVLTHGEETAGLGSTTFLEGAPVPRSALQRRESENEAQATGGGGLQRKKSLAQKIRGMSRGKQDGVVSPEPRYNYAGNGRPMSPRSPEQTQSAGGMAKIHEMNPFFSETQKTAEPLVDVTTDVDEKQFSAVQRTRTASSPPRRGAMRRMTNETSPPSAEVKTGGGGLLNRVKSLKGGRRARPERHERETSS